MVKFPNLTFENVVAPPNFLTIWYKKSSGISKSQNQFYMKENNFQFRNSVTSFL